MKSNPIGIFDSGIGGFGITKSIISLLPNEDIVYIADSKNCPYGTKPIVEIQKISTLNSQYLLEKYNVKLIVVACNTATVSSIEQLRQTFPNIPFIGVVPVVKTAVNETKTGEIAVLSTPNTIKSKSYGDLIAKFASGVRVWSIPCESLADAVETNKDEKTLRSIIENSVAPFMLENFDVAVLGCTHYPLIRDVIQDVLGYDKKLLDSNDAVARHVRRVLENEQLLNTQSKTGELMILTTGTTVLNTQASKLFTNSSIESLSI